LEPLIRFAKTVEPHRDGILRWLQSKVSNGLLKGLSSLVHATKARARGFRSTRHFIAMIYLMHGKLPDLQPI